MIDNDEREALETAIWEALEPRLEDVIDLDLNVPSENVIFAILVGQVVEAVAALRRTEVPEPPSSRFKVGDVVGSGSQTFVVTEVSGYRPHPQMPDEYRYYVAGQEEFARCGVWEHYLRLVKPAQEPQGEPSNADRQALAEFIDKALDGDAGYGVGAFLSGGILGFLADRAALRAAGGVR